ncbi:unnamed protein product [Amoebophrya sp. A25]|nr:unnamed protein product [Amoebophrya sp. A25]|eukprot:GSA25T00017784001.1
MSSPSTRKQCDFTRLIMAGYEVELNEGSTQDFHVTFHGPKGTIYEGAIYRTHVELPEQYPFASPGIGFEPHTIFHPNVDEKSGSVCLDVINQTWTPMYSLVNVFDVFLPQLLTYPNPGDPLNSDAAALFLKDPATYEAKVREYVGRSREKYEIRKRAKDEENLAACSVGSTEEGPSSLVDSNLDSNLDSEADQHGDGELHLTSRDADDELDMEFD